MNALLTLAALKAFTKLSAGKCTSNKCLVGKTAIITGCTTGIGYETTKLLAARGCRIYMNGNIYLNEEIMDLLRYAFNNREIYYHPINLASFASVRKFCDFIKSREKKVDLLIHNAERMGHPRIATIDNILQVLQINHFSPFLITHLLQNELKAAQGSRIIYVANIIAYFQTFKEPKTLKFYKPVDSKMINLVDFWNSKCCQMVSTRMFADKLRAHNVTCNAVYPGYVDIEDRKVHNNIEVGNVYLDTCKIGLDLWSYIYGKTRTEGCQMTMHASLADELANTTGKLIFEKLVLPLPLYTYETNFCNSIWDLSETLCQLRPEEKLQIQSSSSKPM